MNTELVPVDEKLTIQEHFNLVHEFTDNLERELDFCDYSQFLELKKWVNTMDSTKRNANVVAFSSSELADNWLDAGQISQREWGLIHSILKRLIDTYPN
jgi:hypothetical protein